MATLFSRLGSRLTTLRMPTIFTRTRVAFVAGACTAMPVLTGEDFFEHKFITDKAPDDVSR